MRLAYIVTYFPVLTETFILRELLQFENAGAEVRIYHLTPFQKGVQIHDFAKSTISMAHSSGYFFDLKVLSACLQAIVRRPSAVMGVVWRLLRSFYKEPVLLAKSLALLPKSFWLAKDLEAWQGQHMHAGFAGHPATAAWIVERMTGIPYSVSCHGHDIFRSQSLLDEKFARAAFVRVISEFNRNFILDKVPGADSANIKVIHCGVDNDGLPERSNSDGKDFRILYVGSLQPRKGVECLLNALKLQSIVGDWRLDILGDGPSRQNLETLAQSIPNNERIHFAGGQANEVVVEAMRRSDVLVVPSVPGPGGRAEGIPTVLMEALSQGLPVIASRLTGIPELVRHGETGYLFPPGDSKALAGILAEIASNLDAARETAESGRQLVAAEFDLRKNANAMFELFQDYCASGQRGRK